jgi:hypothetical protein
MHADPAKHSRGGHSPVEASGAGSGRKNLVLAAMVFAVAMTFIDQTIVAIAIPNIQKQLSLSATGALGLQQSSEWGWGSAKTVGCLVVGALLMVTFVMRELRIPEPLLRLEIFRDRAFSVDTGLWTRRAARARA